MPYIKPYRRQFLNKVISCHNAVKKQVHVGPVNFDPGELNYIITRIVMSSIGSEFTYTKANAAIGVLECVKLELYRRALAPYEDIKIEENGDVKEYQGEPPLSPRDCSNCPCRG